ncbi:type I polyketide synthase, partial [Nocardia sp. NPDC088792]|uniref:type I polyketide synthase n=1 Tax=Nocardia sp. NPDC088792 TaxID=3364332 RepID=UPI00382F6977
MFGAVVPVTEEGSVILTAELCLRTLPWLTEREFPAAGVVELAIRAADAVGAGSIADLTLYAPVVLPEHGRLLLQAIVAESKIRIYTRASEDTPWTLHAVATTAAGTPTSDTWSSSDSTVEAAVPASELGRAAKFGLHPVLLDAVLREGIKEPGLVPVRCTGITLHATGAIKVQARVSQLGPDTVSVAIVDATGSAVLNIDEVTFGHPTRMGVTGGSVLAVDWPVIPVEEGTDGGIAFIPAPAADLTWLQDQAFIDFDMIGPPAPEYIALIVTADDDVMASTSRTTAWVAEQVHRWSSDERFAATRLVVVTRGAVAVAADEPIRDLGAAAVWGLVRSAQAEEPGRIFLIDADPNSELTTRRLIAALNSQEPQTALRDGAVRAPRLTRIAATNELAAFPDGGTVLVTGGTGGLGREICRHLVREHGVRRLLLLSRSGPAATGAHELVEELAALGAEAVVTACDVADRQQLADTIAGLPLMGVVHAAGVVDDGVLASMTAERLGRVMAPKAVAAWHLHELTSELNLAFFVAFSSMSGILGTAGQANYAAANVFLDALIQHRRSLGLSGVSMAWGTWEQGAGLTAWLSETDMRRLARSGMRPLSVTEGLHLFDRALAAERPLLGLAGLDLAGIRARDDLPMLQSLAGRPAPRGAAHHHDATLQKAHLDPEEREAFFLQLVLEHAAAVLGHVSGRALPVSAAFRELGFDSLTAIELRNRIRRVTGLPIADSVVYDYPTPERFARHLVALSGGGGSTESAPVLPACASADDPVAIVGMACQLPGGITDTEDLWRLLVSSDEAISVFPENRGWDLDGLRGGLHSGVSITRNGGFLPAADFDSEFFGISPREALAMDPQQRLLLETSWTALENAGIDPESLAGSATAVVFGTSQSGYGELVSSLEEAQGHVLTGNSSSVLSGRVSYVLGLEGPAVTVDTACSSSLVALHLAGQALR